MENLRSVVPVLSTKYSTGSPSAERTPMKVALSIEYQFINPLSEMLNALLLSLGDISEKRNSIQV